MKETVLTVDAAPDEVAGLLQSVLTEDEYRIIEVSTQLSKPDPFEPEPKRDIGVAVAVVKFAASAVAGGIFYDVVKRAYIALHTKYGDRVKKTDSDEIDDQQT